MLELQVYVDTCLCGLLYLEVQLSGTAHTKHAGMDSIPSDDIPNKN